MAASASRQAISARATAPLKGRLRVPGDKSISHRALMLGSLTIGRTIVEGLLESDDVLATAGAMRAYGADIQRQDDGSWHVHGLGPGGLHEPRGILDFGNAGTGVRLCMGLAAAHPFASIFTGDASLRGRPMGRIIEPLSEMGAQVIARADGRLPLALRGVEPMAPITYQVPVPSAQVKSAVLLAGLNIEGITTVVERTATRDHTERMLRAFGADVRVRDDESGARRISVTGLPELEPQTIAVPGDPSSAAFAIVAAVTVEGSALTVENVLLNEGRSGLLTTLVEMGAKLTVTGERDAGGERIGDVSISASSLKGVRVPAQRAASMIDEYPILAVAAANASGETRMEGLAELRVKESDRLAAIVDGLRANGVGVESGQDWIAIEGRGPGTVEGGGTVVTHLDHRIAMAFLVLGLSSRQPVRVDDISMIATSFPDFIPTMAGLGATFEAARAA